MRNVFLVGKHEVRTTLARRSFWITTFLFPLLIVGFTILPQIIAQNELGDDQLAQLTAEGVSGAVGYVDQAGVIRALPPDVSPDQVRAFADREEAQAALVGGQIEQYYILPADFLASGDVMLVTDEFSPLGVGSDISLIRYVLNYNLVGDADLAVLLIDPTPAIQRQPMTEEARARPQLDSPLSFSVPFAVMFILFFTITMSAGYMLQSVVKEKENRTAEVLLLSLRPVDLMLGKVLGLAVVALLQMVVWFGGGFLVYGGGASLLGRALGTDLPSGFLVWTLLYFLLGYLVYASALGALGALAPSVREGSQYTFVALLPLLVPLWLNSVFVQSPNGLPATVLSLFPLTAPTAMITRLAAGSVPLWQLLVGLILLALTAYAFVRLAARFFRADTLLSDRSLSWGRIRKELMG